MVLFTSGWLSWIRCVQVSDPRAHGQEGVPNCSSSDRFPGLAFFSILHSKDEQVCDAIGLRDILEGDGNAMLSTELNPEVKDLVPGGDRFGDFVCAGEVHRSRQSLLESCCGLKCSDRHPLACG